MTTHLDTIVVGVDGSKDADAAVRWSFDLARRVGAEVVLVQALGLLQHQERDVVVAALEGTARRLGLDCNFDIERIRWRVDDGDPCSVLLRATSGTTGADLLVVGSRGQGAHSGLLLGSTSLELAEHSTCPIVIVPSENFS